MQDTHLLSRILQSYRLSSFNSIVYEAEKQQKKENYGEPELKSRALREREREREREVKLKRLKESSAELRLMYIDRLNT